MSGRPTHEQAVAAGRKGGSVSSPAKTAAVRLNAKLGGWKKGVPRGPMSPELRHRLSIIAAARFAAKKGSGG